MNTLPVSGGAVPVWTTLPALLPSEVAGIQADTLDALHRLLTRDAVSGNTARSYASALRYWDAWHHAAFGTALPLLRQPREAVTLEVVLAFLAHHTPEEGLACAMPAIVQERLHQLWQPVQPKRRAGTPLLAAATLDARLAALSSCHQLAGLEPPWRDEARFRSTLRALRNRIARVAPPLLRKPKQHLLRVDLDRMVQACIGDGLHGLRDAALLQVAFFTAKRRSELVAMRWVDLAPCRLRAPDGGVVTGYRWSLTQAKGKQITRADAAAVQEALILGAAAFALDRWREVSGGEGMIWRRIISRREHGRHADYKLSVPMDAGDVASVVKRRAAMIGLDPADYAAHSLRSGAATTYLEEGGALSDASDLLDHARSDTTRRFYDRRKANVNAAIRLARGAAR